MKTGSIVADEQAGVGEIRVFPIMATTEEDSQRSGPTSPTKKRGNGHRGGMRGILGGNTNHMSRFTAPNFPRLEILVPIYRALC
eukprot:g19400.t1